MAIACTFFILSLNVGCKLTVVCSHKFIITVLALQDVVFQLFFQSQKFGFLSKWQGLELIVAHG